MSRHIWEIGDQFEQIHNVLWYKEGKKTVKKQLTAASQNGSLGGEAL
jgi:hypothetical protein